MRSVPGKAGKVGVAGNVDLDGFLPLRRQYLTVPAVNRNPNCLRPHA